MNERIATTPFGGGSFGASNFRTERWIEQRREAIEKSANDTGKADKWQLLHALTEAREAFGIGNRTIHVLEVLLGFHQSKEIDGAQPIVVFPSNKEICRRTRGMTDRSVRRHLRALVDCAFLVRRDSPNGKRYCLKDDAGQVDEAFGFDLAPLALKAAAIYEAAERARAFMRRYRKIRGEITLHLRDISRVIATAIDEKRSGAWEDYQEALHSLSGRVGRTTPIEEHEHRHAALIELRAEVENAYLSSLSEQEMSANDGLSDRHIQNSNPESQFDISSRKKEEAEGPNTNVSTHEGESPMSNVDDHADARRTAKEVGQVAPVSLGLFKAACPEFVSLSRDEIRSWQDVLALGDLSRAMLGVSPDAMLKAKAAMGPLGATVAIACILQRHEVIRSPGGYLRALTTRAEEGKFSVRPMIDALIPK